MGKNEICPVLLGGDLNAYFVAKAFYDAYGVRSLLLARADLAVADNPKFTQIRVVEHLDDVNFAVPALLRVAKENKGKLLVLVPCADWYIETLEYARDVLCEHFRFLIPDFELWRCFSDKVSFYKLLDKHGIRYPKTVTVGKNGKDCIEYMLESLSPPYVLKPADSAEYWRNKFDGMKKVYFSNRKEEIEYIAKTIFASGYSARLILQERICKRRVDSDAVARAEAEVLTVFCASDAKAKRAVRGKIIVEENGSTSKGNYAAIVTCPLNDFSKMLIDLLEKVSYRGIANFDILTVDGISYCLELNPRQGRSCDYLLAAGVNIAELLVDDLSEKYIKPDFSYKQALWSALPRTHLLSVCPQDMKSRISELYDRGMATFAFDKKYDSSIKRRIFVLIHCIKQMYNISRSEGNYQ